jgi:hypothetical protein
MKNKENKAFQDFCVKVHERLRIIFYHNLISRVDPSENDILFLKDMYNWYDSSELPWANGVEGEEEVSSQSELYPDTKA